MQGECQGNGCDDDYCHHKLDVDISRLREIEGAALHL